MNEAQDKLGFAWEALEGTVHDLSVAKNISMDEAWTLVESAMAGAPKGLKDLGFILPKVQRGSVITTKDSESIAKRVSKHLRRHIKP